MTMFGDLAQLLTTDATERAVRGNTVKTVTLVVIVEQLKKNKKIKQKLHQVDCRPGNRTQELAKLGINLNSPLRGPRYAFAWIDEKGQLNVGGTSERAKARLRAMYDAVVMAGEDLILF
jgi:hypothetical protein